MKRMGVGILVVLCGPVLLASVGCCEKEKNDLKLISADRDTLTTQNGELRDQLKKSMAAEAELQNKLTAAESELAAGQGGGVITTDNGKKKPIGDQTGASGWEKGLVGDRVTVGTDVLFAAGKATLTAAGHQALDKIAGDIKKSYAGLTVRVYGFTDTDPIHKSKTLWQDNLDLSANRSMAVTRYLVSKGIKADAIETIAMGETHPVTANSTATGKSKNRRVEIVVIKSK
jgi:outer membrane protein OmpA-like peptidoglycan-associated protein